MLSIAVETEAALVTLETIRAMRSRFPNTHTICGASNISMGLPGRKLINRTFLTMAIASGLDTLLIDVRDQAPHVIDLYQQGPYPSGPLLS